MSVYILFMIKVPKNIMTKKNNSKFHIYFIIKVPNSLEKNLSNYKKIIV
jgi:hypothetical protein